LPSTPLKGVEIAPWLTK